MGAVPVCGTALIAFTGNKRSVVVPAGNSAFCQGFYFWGIADLCGIIINFAIHKHQDDEFVKKHSNRENLTKSGVGGDK